MLSVTSFNLRRKLYFCAVKKRFKIVAILCLIILYCLTISIYSGNVTINRVDYLAQSKSEFKAQKSSFSDFLIRTEKSGSTISVYRIVHHSTVKNQVNHYWCDTITAALDLSCHSSQNSFFSNPPIVNFRKCDLIFPFHYFW